MVKRFANKSSKVSRPLLKVHRFEMRQFIRFWKLPIYSDQSNKKTNFSRNKIRKQLMPTLRVFFNPQIDTVLLNFADIKKCEQLYFQNILNFLLKPQESYSIFFLEKKQSFYTVQNLFCTSLALLSFSVVDTPFYSYLPSVIRRICVANISQSSLPVNTLSLPVPYPHLWFYRVASLLSFAFVRLWRCDGPESIPSPLVVVPPKGVNQGVKECIEIAFVRLWRCDAKNKGIPLVPKGEEQRNTLRFPKGSRTKVKFCVSPKRFGEPKGKEDAYLRSPLAMEPKVKANFYLFLHLLSPPMTRYWWSPLPSGIESTHLLYTSRRIAITFGGRTPEGGKPRGEGMLSSPSHRQRRTKTNESKERRQTKANILGDARIPSLLLPSSRPLVYPFRLRYLRVPKVSAHLLLSKEYLRSSPSGTEGIPSFFTFIRLCSPLFAFGNATRRNRRYSFVRLCSPSFFTFVRLWRRNRRYSFSDAMRYDAMEPKVKKGGTYRYWLSPFFTFFTRRSGGYYQRYSFGIPAGPASKDRVTRGKAQMRTRLPLEYMVKKAKLRKQKGSTVMLKKEKVAKVKSEWLMKMHRVKTTNWSHYGTRNQIIYWLIFNDNTIKTIYTYPFVFQRLALKSFLKTFSQVENSLVEWNEKKLMQLLILNLTKKMFTQKEKKKLIIFLYKLLKI